MRILMLGNSFTSTTHLPDLLGRLTGAQVTAHTRGGARLAEQLNPKTRLGGLTQEALRTGHWDYVVLQEMSNGPVTSPEKFRASVQALCEQVRAAGAVPVLYSTWAYQPGCKRLEALGLDYDGMYQNMHEAGRRAARESGALLADVGQAFYEAADRDGLYAADSVHPSLRGTELAAQVLASVILSDARQKP